MQDDALVPVAINGLPDEFYGYRFNPEEHPRPATIWSPINGQAIGHRQRKPVSYSTKI
ncbi:hypothetical protein [Oceanospirillum sediminis]|uniref:Uncharacterized protein n=1 Tax=Oceanospirillum sediminis TaxID=2760088 RepID=A0A839IRQ4_9GAMM|nr:hypothetical protein [Oceanospirillum sediminis]MBB1487601.1 hypothetical protein [Oceanospirillum sediminis]